MKNTVVVLFLLAIAVCVFSATDATMTKTDNVERYTVTTALPVVSGVPAGFLSIATASISTTTPTSVGTVPSTARRMMLVSAGKQYYSFNSTINNTYPSIAATTDKMFVGKAEDLDNMYLLADSATSTVLILFFDE